MGAHVLRRVETRAVMDALRRIVQALRESTSAAERHAGISGAQLFVLHILAESPALALNDLAAATHTHQSSASTVVSQLVARGLVRRTRSTADGRQIQLSLSARGRRLAARAPDAAQARLILAIDRLPAGQRRVVAASLAELARALDAVDLVPPMFFEDHAHTRTPLRRR